MSLTRERRIRGSFAPSRDQARSPKLLPVSSVKLKVTGEHSFHQSLVFMPKVYESKLLVEPSRSHSILRRLPTKHNTVRHNVSPCPSSVFQGSRIFEKMARFQAPMKHAVPLATCLKTTETFPTKGHSARLQKLVMLLQNFPLVLYWNRSPQYT